jgi:hypothetical protein
MILSVYPVGLSVQALATLMQTDTTVIFPTSFDSHSDLKTYWNYSNLWRGDHSRQSIQAARLTRTDLVKSRSLRDGWEPQRSLTRQWPMVSLPSTITLASG